MDKREGQTFDYQLREQDRQAFRGEIRQTEIHGPAKLYRITSNAPDQPGRPPASQKAWWLTEQQMAGFIDPKTGQLDGQRWRAWAAVDPKWQGNADRVHVLELKQGEKLPASTGRAKYQNDTEQPKLAYMGNAEQVFLHKVPPVASHDVRGAQGQEVMREVAQRNPDRLGRLYPPSSPDRDPPPHQPGAAQAGAVNRRNQDVTEISEDRRRALEQRKASAGTGAVKPARESPVQPAGPAIRAGAARSPQPQGRSR